MTLKATGTGTTGAGSTQAAATSNSAARVALTVNSWHGLGGVEYMTRCYCFAAKVFQWSQQWTHCGESMGLPNAGVHEKRGPPTAKKPWNLAS
ncbi:hypothetical protein N7519_007939 [Penicillium mononematosum]|uniref:uncharacterized protein n=1 Tax=Penicillium mononematosum TaxID=268346 RepID=UPI002546F80C|nr:uncharacterized protein N7519_007939 [Penicillium mononematosum]KAJ6186638.1 hypothetical protein N7519_007939 [Penicillium mononematosum]